MSLSNLGSPTDVRTFASLLQPLAERESAEIGGKKLVGRHRVEMEKIQKLAIEEGKAEGNKSGYAKGFEKGQIEGREEGRRQAYDDAVREKSAEMELLHNALAQMVRKVNKAMDKWYERSEPALAQLSALIATRIIAKELAMGPDAVLALTKEAVAEIMHPETARIKVNPFDSAVLREHKQEILAASSSLQDIEIVEDGSIVSGCVIESGGGVVDARLDEKIAEVLESIRKAL